MSDTRIWNKSQCLEFLRAFDAFDHKYLLFDHEAPKNGKTKPSCREEWKVYWKKWDAILNAQSHGIAGHNLSNDEEANAALGIKQVYRDEEHYTNEYLEMLNLVRDKFIYDYTGIEGLCQFFAPAYFEYEWGMHLEIDYDRHESKYYRDHYVHQIRNLYEMFSLLDDFNYYKKCYDAYSDPENRVGTYIFEAIQQEIQSLPDIERRLYRNALWLSGVRNVGVCCKTTREYNESLRKMMFHYIIFSATIIASVVHDIGYPMSYIRRISGGIGKYLPISQLLASVNRDYGAVEQTLKNSLLFKIVPFDTIKKRLDNTTEHGVQSAIVLLMYFCQHGAGLSRLQKCAIELAALVIYNHTQKYIIIDKKQDSPELIRSDIHKEPLSHIFRMCDDLQEWDRVYFEITDKSNIMVCPECMTPITRHFGTDIAKPESKNYYCCCKKRVEGAFDTSRFVSRRILNVIGCDRMRVENLNEDNAPFTKFDLKFDCGALLNIMTFSKSYAKVRAKDIRRLKKLVSYQGKDDTVLVDAFVSGNPLVVKIKVLEEYKKVFTFGSIDSDSLIKRIFGDRKTFGNDKNNKIVKIWKNNLDFYNELKTTGDTFANDCQSVMDELSKSGSFDSTIFDNDSEAKKLSDHFLALGFNTTNPDVLAGYEKIYKDLSKCFRKLAKERLSEKDGLITRLAGGDTLLLLACDYLMQQVHLRGYNKVKDVLEGAPKTLESMDGNSVRGYNLYRQFYEHLYCSDDELCSNVEKYISRDAYDHVKEYCVEAGKTIPAGVDFFVDYALFIRMWELLRESKEYYFKADDQDESNSDSDAAYSKKNGVLYSGERLDTSNLVLQCITQEGDFDNEYRFRVEKYNDEGTASLPTIVLQIDFEQRKGTLKYDSYDKDSSKWKPDDLDKYDDEGFVSCVKKLFESQANLLQHHSITVE